MRSITRSGGFSLIGIIFVVAFVIGAIVIGLIGGVCRGNFWVGEESALKAVQRVDPTMIEVVTLERHVWGYSKVVVRDEKSNERTFAIDASVLQNRRAIPVTEDELKLNIK